MMEVYLFFLVVGGGLAVLSLAGDFLETDVMDLEVDADIDAGADMDMGADAARIFSIQGLVYSLFGFGATGTLLTVLWSGDAPLATLVLALAAGLVAGLAVTRVIDYLRGSDSGAMQDDSSLAGRPARVTLPLQSDSPGRVRIERGARTHVLRALPYRREGGDDPSAWDRVVVVEVRDGIAYVTPLVEDGLELSS